MARSFLLLALLALLPLLACAAAGPANVVAPSARPIGSDRSPASPTSSDSGDVVGVIGWLAFVAEPKGHMPWDSIKASAPVFRFGNRAMPKDTPLAALSLGRNAPLVLRGNETVTHGCDGGAPVSLTVFEGEVAPGMLWIVPATVQARALKLVKSTGRNERVWTLPGHKVVIRKTGVYTAVMYAGNRHLATFDVSKDLMDGYEPQPLDLDSPFLLPQPVAAWQVAGTTLLGMYWRSFEGTHFEILRLDTGERQHVHYLYDCAF